LVEQLICNHQVTSSSLVAGFLLKSGTYRDSVGDNTATPCPFSAFLGPRARIAGLNRGSLPTKVPWMDQQERERMQAKQEADEAFEAGAVEKASAEQLSKWLQALCCGRVVNDQIKHREVIRGITINHVQMARVIGEVEATMKRIDDANKKTQVLVVVLTFAALGVGLLQAFLAVLALCQ
jgi:hypothetical protein